MKKIVIATMLAAASIVATAQITVSGNLRPFLDNTNVAGSSSTSMKSDSSRIGISASETLGGGLTARAMIETSVAATNPVSGSETKFGDRQTTVGLSSNVGSIDIGRKFNSHFLAITSNDVFGTAYGSIAGDVHNLRTIRSGDAIFVTAGAGNFSGSFDRTVTIGTESTSYSAVGVLGPVLATIAVFESGTAKSTMIAGQTSVLKLKTYVSYSMDKDNAVESTGTLVGASMPISTSPLTAKISYGTKSVGDVKAYNVGADYALSKRTALSVAYRNVTGSDTKQTGIGVTHQF
jgi:predicted porin